MLEVSRFVSFPVLFKMLPGPPVFLFFALFFTDIYVQSQPTQRNSSMRVRFQLTLAWFDESWGLRLDRPPPPPDPAALDPVLA